MLKEDLPPYCGNTCECLLETWEPGGGGGSEPSSIKNACGQKTFCLLSSQNTESQRHSKILLCTRKK